MSFVRAHPRCKVCGKRAFFTDQLKTTEGDTFHRACFRCKQCHTPLEVENYASIQGLPYCKPHFEQLSRTPSSADQPHTPPKVFNEPVAPPKVLNEPVTPPKLLATPSKILAAPLKTPIQKLQNEMPRTPNKGTSFKFLGTQDKCVVCEKTVYALEKVSVEGSSYHKSCFRCLQGGCSISPSNYASLEGRVYCKHHFKQLFKEKGNYSQLLVKLPSSKLP